MSTDSIGLRVVVYDVKPGVLVNGCMRRLEVVDPWRSCAGGVCVFTLTARVLLRRGEFIQCGECCVSFCGDLFELLSRKLH